MINNICTNQQISTTIPNINKLQIYQQMGNETMTISTFPETV